MQELKKEVQDLNQNAITLRHVFADYVATRKLKPITLRNYQQRLNKYLGDWMDLPINKITKNMVEERHAKIGGNEMASSTMKTLRALITYASWKHEAEDGTPFIKVNPVNRLSEVRAWHKTVVRKDVLPTSKLKPWFQAVNALENKTFGDLLITLLLTGMRKREGMELRWEQVDLEEGTISIKNDALDHTKNGIDLIIPMSDYLWNMLKERNRLSRSEFVFGSSSRNAHISAATKYMDMVKKGSGAQFSLHTLRRTFATIGDECEIEHLVVKNLLNHIPTDQTDKYTIRSVSRLRKATQRITDRILLYAGIKGVESNEPIQESN